MAINLLVNIGLAVLFVESTTTTFQSAPLSRPLDARVDAGITISHGGEGGTRPPTLGGPWTARIRSTATSIWTGRSLSPSQRFHGVPEVATVALIEHSDTQSAPGRLKLGSWGMSPFAEKRGHGRQESSRGKAARLSGAPMSAR